MKYDAYFIDLDGTLYHGDQIIPEAIDFMQELTKRNIPYLYVTNNSTKTPEQVAEHLRRLGFSAEADQVYTSALATAAYLQEQMDEPSVYMIGEDGLRQALSNAGCKLVNENANVVVVGLDREFHYEKMKVAVSEILHGAKYIATNVDRVLPTEKGIFPGSGSINKSIEWATGVEPLVIGKPEPIILHYAAKRLGVELSNVLMVGDNLDTDILAGINCKMDTLLVLSGVTNKQMVEFSSHKPTYVRKSLAEWSFT